MICAKQAKLNRNTSLSSKACRNFLSLGCKADSAWLHIWWPAANGVSVQENTRLAIQGSAAVPCCCLADSFLVWESHRSAGMGVLNEWLEGWSIMCACNKPPHVYVGVCCNIICIVNDLTLTECVDWFRNILCFSNTPLQPQRKMSKSLTYAKD